MTLRPQGQALPPRLRRAVEWWDLLLIHFPDRKFTWGQVATRPVADVFTDASAERKWEGLGGLAFFGAIGGAQTLRCLTPPELESLLPPLGSQKVRISQLELLAVLLTLFTFRRDLRGHAVRFHIDNQAAKFCLINCYSGNAFMARLASEIWSLLLEFDISPFFDYVPSESNVADIFSRPDLQTVGDILSTSFRWKSVNPQPGLAELRMRVTRSPKDSWTHLWQTLYGGTQGSSCSSRLNQ